MNENELVNNLKLKINNLGDSITILFENNKVEPALILFYSLIEQLSWLSCEKKFSKGADFKAWVKKYMNVDSLNCNAEDLWNHRCSLSHMGTSQSQQFKLDIHHQLGFYSNIHFTDDQLRAEQSKYKYPTKLVNLGALFAAFELALDRFLLEIAKDVIFQNRVLAKVSKMTLTFA